VCTLCVLMKYRLHAVSAPRNPSYVSVSWLAGTFAHTLGVWWCCAALRRRSRTLPPPPHTARRGLRMFTGSESQLRSVISSRPKTCIFRRFLFCRARRSSEPTDTLFFGARRVDLPPLTNRQAAEEARRCDRSEMDAGRKKSDVYFIIICQYRPKNPKSEL